MYSRRNLFWNDSEIREKKSRKTIFCRLDLPRKPTRILKRYKKYVDAVYNIVREEPSDVGYAGKIIACFSKIEPEVIWFLFSIQLHLSFVLPLTSRLKAQPHSSRFFQFVKTYVSPGNDDAAFLVFCDINQTAARCRYRWCEVKWIPACDWYRKWDCLLFSSRS